MQKKGLILLLIALFVTGCGGVSASDYEAITGERDEAIAEVASLRDELSAVQKELAASKAELEEIKSANSETTLNLKKEKVRAVVEADYESQLLINELTEVITHKDTSGIVSNLTNTRDTVLSNLDQLDDEAVDKVYNEWASGVETWNASYREHLVKKTTTKGSAKKSSSVPAAETAKIEQAPAEKTASVPAEGSSALQSAKKYLKIYPFSHDGLMAQLAYDGYPADACKYAADNCGADWNAEAVRSAKKYLEITSMSKKALVDQLKYDKYTSDQATYGADQALQ